MWQFSLQGRKVKGLYIYIKETLYMKETFSPVAGHFFFFVFLFLFFVLNFLDLILDKSFGQDYDII